MIWKAKREDTAVGLLPAQPEAQPEAQPVVAGMVPTRSERSLEQQVREAAEAQRFHVHYQPLFSVPDDSVIGVEALLRWDSDAGRISPARFVPILESTGLIESVGEWILSEACGELAAWPRPDGPGLLTVNVSAHQLVPGFANLVLGTLASAGFPADRLCLELTNPARLVDSSIAWNELRQLKSCGVRLFIDDFGTAGASIVDLKRFVVDAVKIDGSFVKGMTHHEDDDAIVAALIGLAHALGMLAIAEGVETAAQLERLKALGCDLAQGFHFGAPGSAGLVRSLFGG
ncbi:MAG TPA: EAL domain-containing protein [Acidimicrobiia bacterium]|nr:EAL domain-containing protein [Acidimicrobiia bacterium]